MTLTAAQQKRAQQQIAALRKHATIADSVFQKMSALMLEMEFDGMVTVDRTQSPPVATLNDDLTDAVLQAQAGIDDLTRDTLLAAFNQYLAVNAAYSGTPTDSSNLARIKRFIVSGLGARLS